MTKLETTEHISRACAIQNAGEGIAPAVANALAAATGVRLRELPLRLPGEPPEEHWDVPEPWAASSARPAKEQPWRFMRPSRG